jgi:hypothetical protein
MQIIEFHYPTFNVASVTLMQGDKFICPVDQHNASIGIYIYYNDVFYTLDGVTHITDRDTNNGKRLNVIDKVNFEWEDTVQMAPDTVLDYVVADAGGGQWVCISDNGSGRPAVTKQTVAGSYTLPANTRFVVAQGSVTADGVTVNQFEVFGLRGYDVAVSGTADLLLVT